MRKMRAAIIGTGNIGIDLLYKIQKSKFINCELFAGRSDSSRGIEIAKNLDIHTSIESINEIMKHPTNYDIVFDATNASAHKINAPLLAELDVFVIDLTPAKLGEFCIPVINGEECLKSKNINMITCGGQATIPIAYALSRAHDNISYIEMVSTIASKSAGIGTRDNIDEFTQTTSEALSFFSKVKNTKAIIILNPAEPPICMRSTVYAIIDKPNIDIIKEEVFSISKKIQEYVPGYKIILGPIYENGRVTTTIEVEGLGDYLPKYAGNLDIITCAAINMAESYAKTHTI